LQLINIIINYYYY